ncbi:MAG: TPR end-of-group domain-containing protein [Planctomycetota bacterium]|jgi:hypothetical protein
MPRGLALLLLACAALAGGGPETTLVVVNAASPVSRRVAHEYVALRDIPPSHVLYVEGVPHLGAIDLDIFLEVIWQPVHEYLVARGLEDQIDLITYSADFPYAVDFRRRIGRDRPTHASLTGVTYLIRDVLAEQPFWELDTNRYYALRFQARRATAEERALALRAHQALQKKRYREAAEAFAAFLKTYETHADSWYNYACCLARLGRREPALDALEKAVGAGFGNAAHAAQDPDLASLRGAPRLQGILASMGKAGGRGARFDVEPSRGFRSSRERYYLSTQLGYTGRYGNSVPEILAYLRAAAQGDGTRPDGTVYLCRNGDIRSKTREPFFPRLVAELERRGRKVELLDGVLPPGKDDVIGAVVGRAGFKWAKSKSRILPGAICEHLTSFGAHFGTPGQTKLSEFLRHGAAGASGTVIEPMSMHQKFPNPLLHVFYADGCSLAEAFFQSIWGPFQLMVAGDGLARPFAAFTEVAVEAPPSPWKGIVQLSARTPDGPIELWVDGERLVAGRGALALDTTALDDGHHEVRLVAIADDAVETRSYAKLAAVVENHGRQVRIRSLTDPKPALGQDVTIRVEAARAARYELHQGSRILATSTDGKLVFNTREAGPGTFRVTPHVLFKDGGRHRGEPIAYQVDGTNPFYSTQTPPPAPLRSGARGDVDGQPVVVTNLGDRRAGLQLRDQIEAKTAKRIRLAGWFEIKQKGLYQFVVRGSGRAKLSITGGTDFDGELEPQRYVALGLDAGWHTIQLELEPRGRPHFELLLGGAQVLAPLDVRHFSFPALKKPPTVAGEFAALLDGKRDGKGVKVAGSGLVLSWKRPIRGLAAVTLFPARDAKEFPREWTIETTTGYGKWKLVKDLQRIVARPPQTPKGRPEVPLFVEFSFKPVRAKKLRLSLKGEALLTELEVLGAARK